MSEESPRTITREALLTIIADMAGKAPDTLGVEAALFGMIDVMVTACPRLEETEMADLVGSAAILCRLAAAADAHRGLLDTKGNA